MRGEPYLLGVDLGGTKIEGFVLGADRQPAARLRVPTERERGYAHIVERVAEVVARLLPQAPGCTRIGIGTPGSTSARDGTLKNSNTTCLNGRPLLRDLEARLGLPVRLENDANCFALAEAVAGSARGHDLVFGVILGTGVGGGLVLGGRVRPGPQHIAGPRAARPPSRRGPKRERPRQAPCSQATSIASGARSPTSSPFSIRTWSCSAAGSRTWAPSTPAAGRRWRATSSTTSSAPRSSRTPSATRPGASGRRCSPHPDRAPPQA